MCPTEIDHPIRQRVFRAVDVDLPLLAIRAALEIDRQLTGESIGLTNANQLGELIKNSFAPLTGTERRSLMDPGSFAVFSQAMNRAEWIGENIPTDGLIKRSMELAGLLSVSSSTTKDNNHTTDLEKLKRFCLSLSNLSASYRQVVFGIRPPQSMRA